MQAPIAERKLMEEQLRNDYKTYTVDDKGYSWRQTQEDLEITFSGHPLTPAEAKAARIIIQRTRLKVELKGQAVFDDELWEPVRSDESTWTVGDGLLVVQLAKVPLDPPERNNWPRCGRSEPHKYEREYLARRERKEARHRECDEQLLQEVLAEAAQDRPPTQANAPEHEPNVRSRCSVAGGALGPPAESALAEAAEARPLRRRSNATTGTAAERERIKRETALGEERRWKQGTNEESWLRARGKGPNGLGPLSTAEVWRREGRPEGSA